MGLGSEAPQCGCPFAAFTCPWRRCPAGGCPSRKSRPSRRPSRKSSFRRPDLRASPATRALMEGNVPEIKSLLWRTPMPQGPYSAHWWHRRMMAMESSKRRPFRHRALFRSRALLRALGCRRIPSRLTRRRHQAVLGPKPHVAFVAKRPRRSVERSRREREA